MIKSSHDDQRRRRERDEKLNQSDENDYDGGGNWGRFENKFEPMPRIELGTSSLPRKRSTTELHRLVIFLSGRPGSNRRHSAWKADALPTELLPHIVLWGEQDSNLRR